MKLCYNKVMKILIKLFFIFMFLISSVQAISFDVLVLPADLFNSKENYYNFDDVSEIIANDIIYEFSKSNGKVNSPDLYSVRAKFAQNPTLKQSAQNALNQYKISGKIDYSVFQAISNEFGCKSILLISNSAVTNKNSLKRSVWEVLEVATSFNITYPYRMETSVVLLDNVNNIVMWSNNYSSKLGANDNIFAAKNYAQANAEYEKIKMYSKNIVSPSASQNIMLRFFPKSVTPVQYNSQDTGGALKYDTRRLPEMPKKEDTSVPYTGDLLYEY